jgi:hypothetical protein
MQSWFQLITLMAAVAQVVEIRLSMMALGMSTSDEILLVVTEKIEAMDEARTIIMRGGNPMLIIDNYHKIVAANVARLSEANI